MLITFSGLDGSGKSTIIRELAKALEQRGLRVTTLAMYYDVGPYATIRFIRDRVKFAINNNFRKSDSSMPLTSSNSLASRRDPSGISGSFLVVLRSKTAKKFVYVLDLCVFWIFLLYFTRIRRNILIMDRYFYDFLADIAEGGDNWTYIRRFVSLVPTPDLSVFVDVSPEEAFVRKGEYSVLYMHRRRTYYQKILGWVPNAIFMPNNDLGETVDKLSLLVLDNLDR